MNPEQLARYVPENPDERVAIYLGPGKKHLLEMRSSEKEAAFRKLGIWNSDDQRKRQENRDYLSPDALMQISEKTRVDCLAFIHNDKYGLLASVNSFHLALFRKLPEYKKATEQAGAPRDTMASRAIEILGQTFLIGRGLKREHDYVISFWNDDYEVYRLLGDCLKALEEYIPEDLPVEIHTPFRRMNKRTATTFTREHAQGSRKQRETWAMAKASPEKREKLALQKKLHLLRGNEKKDALKKLGLWNDKKAQHPWQRELEKAGEIGPGQKWWAPQSEQIQHIAQTIEDI